VRCQQKLNPEATTIEMENVRENILIPFCWLLVHLISHVDTFRISRDSGAMEHRKAGCSSPQIHALSSRLQAG